MNVPKYQLGSLIFTESDAQRPDIYKQLLSAKLRKSYPICLCNSPAPKVVIAIKNGVMHFRAFPKKGHLHKQHECEHYQPDPSLGAGGLYLKAIREKEDGSVDYKLSFPLKIKKNESLPLDPSSKSKGSAPGVQRGSVGLLGFLHDLWIRAGLDTYDPTVIARRKWDLTWKHDVAPGLVDTLDNCSFGRRDSGSKVFVCAPATSSGQNEWLQFSSSLDPQDDGQPLGIIIGSVRSIAPTPYGGVVKADYLQESLWLGQPEFESLLKSFPTEMALLKEQEPLQAQKIEAIKAIKVKNFDLMNSLKKVWPGEVVLIALVMKSSTKKIKILRAALMACTKQFIPVDSLFERDVGHLLVEQNRWFNKPVRYDEGKDVLLPDFILLDTSPEMPMEIYGISNNPKYETRKAEKRLQYQSSGRTVWEWTPHEQKYIPAFPPV